MNYASCWIQACILSHAFALNIKLETDIAWLEDGGILKRQQKENKQQQQLWGGTKFALTNREDMGKNGKIRQRDCTLREEKLRRKQLKYHYFCTLKDYN